MLEQNNTKWAILFYEARKETVTKSNDTPDLFIKRPYYGAHKEFGWTDKNWGWGIADDKIDKLEGEGKDNIVIVLEKPSHKYKVPLSELRKTIRGRNSYNVNGNVRCGYVTEYDIAEIAVKGRNRTGE